MQYIHQDEKGVFHFTTYFEYIESIFDKIPKHLYNFAKDFGRYSLNHPSSLHDTWLSSLTVSENYEKDDSSIAQVEIHLSLLGQLHDRYIELVYKRVSHYSFEKTLFQKPPTQTAHGDLIVHEIRLTDFGKICHEVLFSKGAVFLIECEDIVCIEKKIK